MVLLEDAAHLLALEHGAELAGNASDEAGRQAGLVVGESAGKQAGEDADKQDGEEAGKDASKVASEGSSFFTCSHMGIYWLITGSLYFSI